MLVVEVNGDRREVAAGSTVATLIEELGLHPRGVAVEYNGEILKRTAYAGHASRAGGPARDRPFRARRPAERGIASDPCVGP